MNELFSLLSNTAQLEANKKLLVIFFRGAWCVHCKKQLQDFELHRGEFERANIQLLGVAPDTKFKLSLLKNFLRLSFPLLADENFSLIDALDLRTVYKEHTTSKPAIILFNQVGDIIHQEVATDYDDRTSARATLEQITPLLWN